MAAATKPGTSAPIAAVAVQPYQYIAGARNPSAGVGDIFRMDRAH
jgi:hypothetical protein